MKRLAILLLEDDYGISEEAWEVLREKLVEAGHTDIVEHVEATDGRFYLPAEESKQ